MIAVLVPLVGFGWLVGRGGRRRAQRRRVPRTEGTVAEVVCPLTGEATQVRVGVDRFDGHIGVVCCDRFPGGPPECERACFPTAEPVAF